MNNRVLCLSNDNGLAARLGTLDGLDLKHASPSHAQTWLESIHPDVVVLDIRDDSAALTRIEALQRWQPGVRILLIVDEQEDDQVLLRFLFAGVVGYITHLQAQRCLHTTIVALQQNQAWLPRQMVSQLIDTITTLNKN